MINGGLEGRRVFVSMGSASGTRSISTTRARFTFHVPSCSFFSFKRKALILSVSYYLEIDLKHFCLPYHICLFHLMPLICLALHDTRIAIVFAFLPANIHSQTPNHPPYFHSLKAPTSCSRLWHSCQQRVRDFEFAVPYLLVNYLPKGSASVG